MNKIIDGESESLIIEEIKNGTAMLTICRQHGINSYQFNKLLFGNHINYNEYNGIRQQRRYEKIFNKSFTMAASLKRLPFPAELKTISGISLYSHKIIEDLKLHGYHYSGKKDVPLPLPCSPAQNLQPEFKINKELLTDELLRIHAKLGREISKEDIKKYSFYNASAYKLIFFSLGKALSDFNRQVKNNFNEKKPDNSLERLKQFALESGSTPGKSYIVKKDKNLYMQLYRRYGGLKNAIQAAGLPSNESRAARQYEEKKAIRNQLILKLREGIQTCGKVPEAADLEKVCGVSETELLKHFPGYTTALRQAGFKPPVHFSYKQYDSDEILLLKLKEISQSLGHQLKTHEYKKYTGYSYVCYMRRFGSVPQARIAAGIDHLPFAEEKKCITKTEIDNKITYLQQLFISLAVPLTCQTIQNNGKKGYNFSDFISLFGSIQNMVNKTRIEFLEIKQDRKKLYIPEGENFIAPPNDLLQYLHELSSKNVVLNKTNFMLYQKPGFTMFDYIYTFQSFKNALQSARLNSSNSQNKYTDEKLISLLKYAIEKNNGIYNTQIFKKYNLPAATTYFHHFHDIPGALQKHNIPFKGSHTPEFEMLEKLFTAYKLNGDKMDIKSLKKFGLCAPKTYSRKFGNLKAAVVLAIQQNVKD